MPVGYDFGDGVATVTFDRPEVLNAFDENLGRDALAAVRRAAGDESVRCVVLTGAGRAFSSGQDLAALRADYSDGATPDLSRILRDYYNPLIRAICGAPKPVVAALNGVAAGAGASIALACDFRIASEEAKLMFPFFAVALVPDSGALWFLARMIGHARAWDLVAAGAPVGAREALDLGLVNEVVGAEELGERCLAFAARLAAGPTGAYALTKALLYSAPETTLADALEREAQAQGQAGRTADHREGVEAWLAKRTPRFGGR